MAASNGQSRNSDEPPFFATTLLTGQPKLMSMKSGCTQSITARAASPKRSGSPPKSCTPSGLRRVFGTRGREQSKHLVLHFRDLIEPQLGIDDDKGFPGFCVLVKQQPPPVFYRRAGGPQDAFALQHQREDVNGAPLFRQ